MSSHAILQLVDSPNGDTHRWNLHPTRRSSFILDFLRPNSTKKKSAAADAHAPAKAQVKDAAKKPKVCCCRNKGYLVPARYGCNENPVAKTYGFHEPVVSEMRVTSIPETCTCSGVHAFNYDAASQFASDKMVEDLGFGVDKKEHLLAFIGYGKKPKFRCCCANVDCSEKDTCEGGFAADKAGKGVKGGLESFGFKGHQAPESVCQVPILPKSDENLFKEDTVDFGHLEATIGASTSAAGAASRPTVIANAKLIPATVVDNSVELKKIEHGVDKIKIAEGTVEKEVQHLEAGQERLDTKIKAVAEQVEETADATNNQAGEINAVILEEQNLVARDNEVDKLETDVDHVKADAKKLHQKGQDSALAKSAAPPPGAAGGNGHSQLAKTEPIAVAVNVGEEHVTISETPALVPVEGDNSGGETTDKAAKSDEVAAEPQSAELQSAEPQSNSFFGT